MASITARGFCAVAALSRYTSRRPCTISWSAGKSAADRLHVKRECFGHYFPARGAPPPLARGPARSRSRRPAVFSSLLAGPHPRSPAARLAHAPDGPRSFFLLAGPHPRSPAARLAHAPGGPRSFLPRSRGPTPARPRPGSLTLPRPAVISSSLAGPHPRSPACRLAHARSGPLCAIRLFRAPGPPVPSWMLAHGIDANAVEHVTREGVNQHVSRACRAPRRARADRTARLRRAARSPRRACTSRRRRRSRAEASC